MSGKTGNQGVGSGVMLGDNARVGRNIGLAGSIAGFALETAPVGWLVCDGSTVASATYPALYTAIGHALWGGDADNFGLPDLRGKFIRGWANGSSNDPNRADRTAGADEVGSQQPHGYPALKSSLKASHQGADYTLQIAGGASPYGTNDFASLNVSQYDGYHYETSYTDYHHYRGCYAPVGLTGVSETRPINDYVLYCIFYGHSLG